jgi:hypothetical protein
VVVNVAFHPAGINFSVRFKHIQFFFQVWAGGRDFQAERFPCPEFYLIAVNVIIGFPLRPPRKPRRYENLATFPASGALAYAVIAHVCPPSGATIIEALNSAIRRSISIFA